MTASLVLTDNQYLSPPSRRCRCVNRSGPSGNEPPRMFRSPPLGGKGVAPHGFSPTTKGEESMGFFRQKNSSAPVGGGRRRLSGNLPFVLDRDSRTSSSLSYRLPGCELSIRSLPGSTRRVIGCRTGSRVLRACLCSLWRPGTRRFDGRARHTGLSPILCDQDRFNGHSISFRYLYPFFCSGTLD